MRVILYELSGPWTPACLLSDLIKILIETAILQFLSLIVDKMSQRPLKVVA